MTRAHILANQKPPEQGMSELTVEFAKALGFQLDSKSGNLIAQKGDGFFLYTQDNQAIAQLPSGDLYAVHGSKDVINAGEIRKIKLETKQAVEEEILSRLRRHQIMYHLETDEFISNQDNMGDQYRYNLVITVKPSQEWFFKNATDLMQEILMVEQVKAAKSVLFDAHFQQGEPVMQTLDAQEIGLTANKMIGRAKAWWIRRHVDPRRFQEAVNILSKQGFNPREPVVTALKLSPA